jgi:hypothetical protein
MLYLELSISLLLHKNNSKHSIKNNDIPEISAREEKAPIFRIL